MSSTNLFFEWLVQGPYLLFAAIVGVIVSIDVFVVEATRDYPERGAKGTKNPIQSVRVGMALTHASMHAFSFFIYTAIIYGLQFVTFFSIQFLDVPYGVFQSMLVLFNFLVMTFVWWTYRSKINEDHSDKDEEDSAPERYDMRFFVDICRTGLTKLKIPSVPGLTIAATVAVDMLAVSALLKVWLIPNGSDPAVATFTGQVLLDLAIFAAVIFCVVLFAVFVAHAVNNSLRNREWALAFLRLAEPFAIFYIMAGVLRGFGSIVDIGVERSMADWEYLALDLGFAAGMTASLMIANGLGFKGLMKLSRKRSTHKPGPEPREFKEIFREFQRKLYALPWVLVVMLTVTISLWYSFTTGARHNHIVEATGYFSALVAFITILALYLPSAWLDNRERHRSAEIFADVSRQRPKIYWQIYFGTVVAFSVLGLHMAVVFGSRNLVVEASIMWSVYAIVAWGLFNLRRYRFYKAERSSKTPALNRITDADAGEYASTIGLSSAIITVLVQFLERKPF